MHYGEHSHSCQDRVVLARAIADDFVLGLSDEHNPVYSGDVDAAIRSNGYNPEAFPNTSESAVRHVCNKCANIHNNDASSTTSNPLSSAASA